MDNNDEIIEIEENGEKRPKKQKKGFDKSIFFVGILIGFAVAIGLFVVVAGIIIYTVLGQNGTVVNYNSSQKLKLLESVIHTYYLKDYEVVDEELQNGMYKGMLAALGDPYTVYYTKDEYKEMLEDTQGSFEGVGLYLSQDPETKAITVARPIDDSPAMKAGVLAGDILISVDDEDITGLDLNVVVSRVKGLSGTSVKLGFIRDGEEMSFSMERSKIERDTITYRMEDEVGKVGYIYISEFDEVTPAQFSKALEDLKNQGMKSLVIDVRDNPGGSLSAVCDICDLFVNKETIVYVEDRNKKQRFYDGEEGKAYEGKMAVLTNGNSASASEILTGCLKDYGLATIIGTKTFGKGIVQTLLPLGDGTAVKITIEDYYTPNGNNIHGVGIEPDVEIELDVEKYKKDKTDNQLLKAVEILNK